MLSNESRAAAAALGFLTRIPLPLSVGDEDVARSGMYFPCVGAGVGFVGAAVTRHLGAPLGLAAQTLLTGALHLDALADSADALGTSDRERALEIMRDSRIGSFGTAAMVLDLLVKARALDGVDTADAVAAGALSRAVPVILAALVPYARASGTGSAFSQGGASRAVVAALGALALARSRDAAVIAGLVGVGWGRFWQRRTGGLTGDTLGASIELTEALILAWAARGR